MHLSCKRPSLAIRPPTESNRDHFLQADLNEAVLRRTYRYQSAVLVHATSGLR
jgi:hypothetical protein